MSLLDEIERDALDSTTNVADSLRKCIALGGQAGSPELRDWAARELHGYDNADDVPSYRRITAPIAADGAKGSALFKQYPVSPYALPDFTRGAISEEVPLTMGIGEIEQIGRRNLASGESIHLGLPEATTLASFMNEKIGDPYQQFHTLYWNISPTSFLGVVDRVRSTLVSLVAEIRAATPDAQRMPSADAASQAVNIVLHGGKRNIIQVMAQGDESVATLPRDTGAEGDGSTRRWIIVGSVAGVVLVVLAGIQLSTGIL